MDDEIIDLGEYLERKRSGEVRRPERVFAVWGGEGERARLALPVWRAVYLLEGDRGGIVWCEGTGEVEGSPRAFFVLDLRREPARHEFDRRVVEGIRDAEAPSMGRPGPGMMALALGGDGERRWFLVVTGPEELTEPVGKDREDLLFLAGECAGLLLHRSLSREDR